ncbi:MAG: amidohydrolase [Petrotogaceae bacterium]|jgi:imidazolonepropionase-like amidohydrolase|nr:amidohydrolase [Petrotogaceae bacterium]
MDVLIKKGFICPVVGKAFTGDILISGGKIKKISESVTAKDAQIIDAKGKFILPGFIDAHSHIGLFEEGVGQYYQDGNEATDPLTPQVRAIDAFNPQDSAIKKALSGGVTTTMILPGSANAVGGQGAIIKLNSQIVDQMIVRQPAGLKMALGENPKRFYGESMKRTPGTRLGTAAMIREYFVKTQSYSEKKQKGDYEKDLRYEIGEMVLKREIPARIHAHRMDDILTAVRIASEFGFDFVIEHATEAYKIIEYLKARDVKMVLGPLFSFATKLELKDKTFEAVSIAVKNNVPVALMCDHPVVPMEYTVMQLGTALKYGVSEEELLKLVTINPARILKIDDSTGSLEKDKDADIVIWSGNPFEMKSYVEQVLIQGECVFSR